MKHNLINLSTFVLTAAILLICMNDDVLYMAQDRSFFMQGGLFARSCLRHVGGGLEWAGCALTSLFVSPWLGAAALILLWVACYLLLCHACRFTPHWRWVLLIPSVALLVSVTDLGYWVYYLRQPGYFFRETLGVLILLLLANVSSFYLALALAVLLYPLTGFYAVSAMCMLLLRAALRRQWLQASLAVLLLVLAPPLIAKQYTSLPWAEAWSYGYPLLSYQSACPLRVNLPLAVAILSAVLLPLMRYLRPEQGERTIVADIGWKDWRLALSLPLCALPFLLSFDSPHYHAELRSYRAIDEFRFDEVLRQYTSVPEGPTRQMIMQKNVALLHTGHLGDYMFRYRNTGPEPRFEGLNAHTAQMEAPQFYLFHGLANDATRWCFENNIEQGICRGHLKIQTLAALISEEWQLALKYLDLLRLDPACHTFVARYYPLALEPSSIVHYEELRLMKMLHDDLIERIAGDQGDVEARIYRSFSHQLAFEQDYTQEVALTYAMMHKDYKLIWQQLDEYRRRHPGKLMPVHFQEAAYVGLQVDPMGHQPSDFQFSPEIEARYKRFKSQRQPVFDQSYWWHLYFCKNVKVY